MQPLSIQISLNTFFYQPIQRFRKEVCADILALEQEIEGLLQEIVALGGAI